MLEMSPFRLAVRSFRDNEPHYPLGGPAPSAGILIPFLKLQSNMAAATSLKGMITTSRNLILRGERKCIWVNLDRSYLAGHVQVKRTWLRGSHQESKNLLWKKCREDF
ncbi:predicted protein [Histoplasma capsulatum G186AR]|uniref:Uncharacterized protein n=1 Tax=Ajellomyces capsulatus (strain G186AR / H82 / ATCC MYA-2454 / RMSCC 2432) TaxID=447093 RepID=C0NJH9_AJECG|nr:uncharacterized protein HCBG_03309 [Histoplasma capsulatum G186AR]EEH08020.1 predicted protein [Histoplasma capsulatum G186AR]